MPRPATALVLAAAGLALAAPAPAGAAQTPTQRFFSERLQADAGTSKEIKDLLSTRQAFVDHSVTFRDLTGECVARFPDCAPYGGEFPDPIPHLTAIDQSIRVYPTLDEAVAFLGGSADLTDGQPSFPARSTGGTVNRLPPAA